jgi:O-antigen/teichoic acid export membrane protein
MLDSIKLSLKNSLVYGLGNIAVKIIGFLLIPLYTDLKYFTQDDFGVMILLDTSGLVVISIVASIMPQSLIRWYWDKDHANNQKGIFFMSLSTQIVISMIFCVLFFPFSHPISVMLFSSGDWSFAIKLLILASAIQSINNIVNTLMQLQSRSVLFSVVNFFKLLIVFSLTIFFIIYRHMGLAGIYLAQVIGNTLFMIFLSGYTIKNCKISFNLITFSEMNIYGFPFLIANFAAVALQVIDRYSLNSMSTLKFVAIYGFAFKIASVLKLIIVDTFRTAISPMVLQKMNSPGNKRFYSKSLSYSSFILMFGIIAISLFSLEAIKIFVKSTAFWSAYFVVPVLSIAVFFTNMREVSTNGLIITKKTKILSSIVIISSILNLLLNLLLIPLWNIIGCALATLLTQVFYWGAIYFFAQKAFFIPFEKRKISVILLCGIILSFSGLLLNDMSVIPRLAIKTTCLISFPFILYFLNFYEPVEIQSIKGFIAKWSDLRNFRKNLKSIKGIK